MKKEMVQIYQIRVGPNWMALSYYSLRRISCPRGSPRLTKCEEGLLGFGCPRTKSCTSALFPSHIYYTHTLKHHSCSWRSYMKGSVEATQEADLCLTEASLRDIGGLTCKRKHKSMWRNVTNAKDLPKTFINQGVSLIICLAHGLLLNGS